MTPDLALRSAAILAAAWLLIRLMPRATAATRHLVWHAALMSVLFAPVISPLIPAIPLAPLAQMAEVTQVAQVQQVWQAQVAEVPQVHGAPVPQTAGQQVPQGQRLRVADVLSILVTLGTVICVVWFFLGWIVTRRVSRGAAPAPLQWQVELNTLCDRLRITRAVRLGIIVGPCSPLATGLWNATILLPQMAAGWTAERRSAVFLHELAHIRRHDCRVQLFVHAACALYWFNPLVWIAAAHLRAERERACDDEVLRHGARASSYAAHLLDIARDLRPTIGPTAALAMARPSELEGRLLGVLATDRARVPSRASRWAAAAVLALITITALGATPTQRPPEAQSSARPRGYVARNDVMEEDRRATMRQRTTAEQTLQRSSDPQERELAVLALAFSSGRDVIPALLDALRDVDSQVREKAAIGLALRRDARVVEPLIAAMNDPDSQVREKTAMALGTSGDSRAADVLMRAMTDPDSQVREKATSALVLLGLTNRSP